MIRAWWGNTRRGRRNFTFYATRKHEIRSIREESLSISNLSRRYLCKLGQNDILTENVGESISYSQRKNWSYHHVVDMTNVAFKTQLLLAIKRYSSKEASPMANSAFAVQNLPLAMFDYSSYVDWKGGQRCNWKKALMFTTLTYRRRIHCVSSRRTIILNRAGPANPLRHLASTRVVQHWRPRPLPLWFHFRPFEDTTVRCAMIPRTSCLSALSCKKMHLQKLWR